MAVSVPGAKARRHEPLERVALGSVLALIVADLAGLARRAAALGAVALVAAGHDVGPLHPAAAGAGDDADEGDPQGAEAPRDVLEGGDAGVPLGKKDQDVFFVLDPAKPHRPDHGANEREQEQKPRPAEEPPRSGNSARRGALRIYGRYVSHNSPAPYRLSLPGARSAEGGFSVGFCGAGACDFGTFCCAISD